MPARRGRNSTRGSTALVLYVLVVTLFGLSLDLSLFGLLTVHDVVGLGAGFWLLTAMLMVLEVRPLFTAGSRDANGVTTSTAFVFAILLHWGLAVAALVVAAATIVEGALKGKAPWRIAFNAAQYSISYAAAGLVLQAFGENASLLTPESVDGGDVPVLALAALAYFLANTVMVSWAIALHERRSLWDVLRETFAYQAVTTGALVALAPLVVVAMERSIALVPLLLFPLVAVYKAASVSMEKEHQSMHDVLTGLPNRKLLLSRTRDAVRDSHASGAPLALMLIDLDRFKEVNDTLGHQMGDRLLVQVSRRLEAALRPGDLVARLGGDEFAVLLSELRTTDTAEVVAKRLLDSLAAPFDLDGLLLDLEASIGIALHPEHGDDLDTLMQRADVAMYLAKGRRAGFAVYEPEADSNSPLRLQLLSEFRTALDSGELVLHFQPKAEMATGRIVGAEALVRWQHPERGLVLPAAFVPLAEQTGLMQVLSRYVVDAGLREAAEWRARGLELTLAINVSGRDLVAPDFAGYVRERLEHYAVPGSALVLEITERVLMGDADRVATCLDAITGFGVQVSLDDFGTGYSSLKRLKRLPVSEIKIDRSFVLRMDTDPDSGAIVRSVVDLARALSLRVVAEGVESLAAWEGLRAMGCEQAQGWYLSKALPSAAFLEWFAGFRPYAHVYPVEGAGLVS